MNVLTASPFITIFVRVYQALRDQAHGEENECPQARMSQTSPAVAFLVDGDNHTNIKSEQLAYILAEAGKFGGVMTRRVYGNWSEGTMQKWRQLCQQFALEPMCQLPVSQWKNAADIALAVDAIELLHCQGIKHFVLLASDSDYTPLVRRLRAAGALVMVIGRERTNVALRQSCTLFLPLEQICQVVSPENPPDQEREVQPMRAPTPQQTQTKAEIERVRIPPPDTTPHPDRRVRRKRGTHHVQHPQKRQSK